MSMDYLHRIGIIRDAGTGSGQEQRCLGVMGGVGGVREMRLQMFAHHVRYTCNAMLDFRLSSFLESGAGCEMK